MFLYRGQLVKFSHKLRVEGSEQWLSFFLFPQYLSFEGRQRHILLDELTEGIVEVRMQKCKKIVI
jgi:hypothetical protein